MGWCSGTEVFDEFAEWLIKVNDLAEVQKVGILMKLITALENHDWDCQQDSRFYDHYLVEQAIQRLHPTWFDEET